MIKLIDALRLCDKILFNGEEMIQFWPKHGSPIVEVVINDSDDGDTYTTTVDGSQVIEPDETGVCEIEDCTGREMTLELMVYVPFCRAHVPEELLT